MRRIWVGISIALMVAAAGCGADAEIEVTDAWGRPAPAVATNGAFYMVITNNAESADHLVSVSSDACGATELHESMMKDGVMSMSPVGAAGIEIPAGGNVALEVGGLHVMCIDKKADFGAGDTYEVTLRFENAGSMTVEVEIREG